MFKTNVPTFVTTEGDQVIKPFGPSIFQTEIPRNTLNDLINEGRKLTMVDDFNPNLAGNLKYGRSYHYKRDFIDKLEPFLKDKCEKYFNAMIDNYGNTQQALIYETMQVQHNLRERRQGNLRLDTLWVNFSQKHDFNPPHDHTGVLSFVIFCKVPEEIFTNQADSNAQNAGNIVFQYGERITHFMGCEYAVKPYEGLMFVFPSKLKHYVPAYWVDAERISVSGNFVVF